jgi:hypothetical protein
MNTKTPTDLKALPVSVHQALEAICGRGKGRCWYCDKDLPGARRAIRQGWDVQRLNDHPIASIILVCPGCRRQQAAANADLVASARSSGGRRKAIRPPLAPRGIPASAAVK